MLIKIMCEKNHSSEKEGVISPIMRKSSFVSANSELFSDFSI
ncbi:hypothetical protein EZS27_017794 [termite gut metagenome]|uniref:Uncharacterized protein n=1 Tax=termite gut metagenome TaxID=433724 RepID=A0A5J4RJZ4_9ZZZZ